MVACSESSPPKNPCTATTETAALTSAPTGSNVMSVTVNGSNCPQEAGVQYPNEICAAVTLCEPGTSTCQTIDGILVDTGSYGLRVFKSLITISLINETSAGATIADCVRYGDGSSQWGPVAVADVKLGGLVASSVPIHLVESTFATAPSACTSSQSFPDTSPSQAGFNGILGLGLFQHDCGTPCTTITANGQYYKCTGSSCSASKVALSLQVQNPAPLFSTDNNGLLVKLPSVTADCGIASASGAVVFGIGTQSNNSGSGLTALVTDSGGDFDTTFGSFSSTAIPGFIDSGSSNLFIPPPSGMEDCGAYGSSWEGVFCPSSTQTLTAVNAGISGSPTNTVSFSVGNGYFLNTSGNYVFFNAGALSGDNVSSSAFMDYGLPYFLGKTVAVGFDSQTSSLGTGPYFAY